MNGEQQFGEQALTDLLYYNPRYLHSHNYHSLKSFQNQHFRCHFDILDDTAVCLPFSPFGGIETNIKNNLEAFVAFFRSVEEGLKYLGVQTISITQPPHFYSGFVGMTCLQELGFTISQAETLHYVDLSSSIQLHEMQKRKLRKYPELIIRKEASNVDRVHNFIVQCRKSQGLTINISKQKFQHLINQLPHRYEAFTIDWGHELICATVMTRVTEDICYYYLPATNPKFKQMSPMVHMLDHLYHYYQAEGFRIMDLGLSSISGKTQEGLSLFKKRMGAKTTERHSLVKKIH